MSLNMGILTGIKKKVADTMERGNIAYIENTNRKQAKAREMGRGFKLFCAGGSNKKNGVGLLSRRNGKITL